MRPATPNSATRHTIASTTPKQSPPIDTNPFSMPARSPTESLKPSLQNAIILAHPEVLPDFSTTRSHAVSNTSSNQNCDAPEPKHDTSCESGLKVPRFPSTNALRAPPGLTDYMRTMQSQSQPRRLSTLPSARQMLRKRREHLFTQALKDSIVNSSKANIALRISIADEVKSSIEGGLTGIEKDPNQTIIAVRSQGKHY